MRRCYSLSLCSLVLIVLLVTGCTQPGTDPQKAVTPAPAVAGSSAGEISPQTTPSQITRRASPAVTVTEVQKRGTPDPDFIVDISVPEKIWPSIM